MPVVRPAAKREVVDGRGPAAPERDDVVELDLMGRPAAPPGRADERANASVPDPNLPPDVRGNLPIPRSALASGSARTGAIGTTPTLLARSDGPTNRLVEHANMITVGDGMAEERLQAPEIIDKRAIHRHPQHVPFRRNGPQGRPVFDPRRWHRACGKRHFRTGSDRRALG